MKPLTDMANELKANDSVTVKEYRQLESMTKNFYEWTYDDAVFVYRLYIKFNPPDPITNKTNDPNKRVDSSITQPDKPVG